MGTCSRRPSATRRNDESARSALPIHLSTMGQLGHQHPSWPCFFVSKGVGFIPGDGPHSGLTREYRHRSPEVSPSNTDGMPPRLSIGEYRVVREDIGTARSSTHGRGRTSFSMYRQTKSPALRKCSTARDRPRSTKTEIPCISTTWPPDHSGARQLETVLHEAGFALADVVRLSYYATDVAAFMGAGDVLGPRLERAGCCPASALLGISALGFKGLMVELEATAAK